MLVKKLRVAVALACVIALPIAMSANAASALAAQTTITTAMLTVSEPAWNNAIARFEKANPSITVNTTYYATGALLNDVVIPQLAGGGGPAVFYSAPQTLAPGGVPTLVKPVDEIVNLTSQSWAKYLDPTEASLAVVDKKTYGWGMGLTGTWFIYNEKMFKQHKWQVPTTFSDLVALCHKVKAAGISTPVSFGGLAPQVESTTFNALADSIIYAKDPNWTQQRLANKVTFKNTPGWKQAATDYEALIKAGCFGNPAAAAATGSPQATTNFATGVTAMYWGGGSAAGSASAQNPSLEVGNFPVPGPTAAQTRLAVHPNGIIVINRHVSSSVLAASKKFVDFLAEPTESREFNALSKTISPYESNTGVIPAYEGDLKTWFKAKKTITELSTVMPNSTMFVNEGTMLQGLFTGQTKVSQVPAALDSEWKAR